MPCKYHFTDSNDADLFKKTKRCLDKIGCSVTLSEHDSEWDQLTSCPSEDRPKSTGETETETNAKEEDGQSIWLKFEDIILT